MIKQLLSSRRFAPLFWSQFCSALNDNVLKNALVIMLLYGVAAEEGAPLVTLAAAGFYLHSIPLLFVALALFGVIAALFGPVKYAILPDQLQVSELATGNALVEGATFMAILLGTIAGGQLVAESTHMALISSAVVLLALLSW